ncbi:MAG: hypothetical protein ACRC2Y_04385 [Aeromonas veronii]
MNFKAGDKIEKGMMRNDLGRSNWVIKEINELDDLPRLKALSLENGFDGRQYILVSLPTGRQRKTESMLCNFGTRSKTFQSAL